MDFKTGTINKIQEPQLFPLSSKAVLLWQSTQEHPWAIISLLKQSEKSLRFLTVNWLLLLVELLTVNIGKPGFPNKFVTLNSSVEKNSQ